MSTRAPATRRSQRTRAELAQAAHDALAATGTLQPDEIAAAAGVSTATFYAHFGTHDDAIAAGLDLALVSIVAVVDEEFHIEALIERGVPGVVERLVTRSHAVFRDESLVLRAALARHAIHPAIAEVYRSHEERSHAHLVRQVALGQKAGVLADGDPARRATSLLVALQGLHNPLLTKRRLDQAISNDLVRSIVALLTAS